MLYHNQWILFTAGSNLAARERQVITWCLWYCKCPLLEIVEIYIVNTMCEYNENKIYETLSERITYHRTFKKKKILKILTCGVAFRLNLKIDLRKSFLWIGFLLSLSNGSWVFEQPKHVWRNSRNRICFLHEIPAVDMKFISNFTWQCLSLINKNSSKWFFFCLFLTVPNKHDISRQFAVVTIPERTTHVSLQEHVNPACSIINTAEESTTIRWRWSSRRKLCTVIKWKSSSWLTSDKTSIADRRSLPDDLHPYSLQQQSWTSTPWKYPDFISGTIESDKRAFG